MKIALAGNPNSGKTTMYNVLTGANEKVGNWAGVTVEKKERFVKKSLCDGMEIVAVDLPGAYSMSPFTSEESVTRDYIKTENPDVIINIVDATNLGRSLFFTTELLELGIPVVVALNKADINKRKNNRIDKDLLSENLLCPVVDTISTSAEGVKEVLQKAISLVGNEQKAPFVPTDYDLSSKDAAYISDRERFQFINKIVALTEKRKAFTKDRNSQDKVDAVLTSSWLGISIFAAVMFLVFQISQAWAGPLIADNFTALLEMGQEYLRSLLVNASPLTKALLVDGVIGGVIAVIGFLPLVMIMYFLIALLEDCGYMARVSVVLDPIFKKVGLSGKSVIPFVVGTGCAVPGVMACRTIRNERERRATAMLAPFMPCGAKLPVIALFAGAFFSDASWVGTLMYFAGIVIIFFGALIINKITGYNAKKSYFIIELPEYKMPSFARAFGSMVSRGWEYIVKAATIILICNTAVQIMQMFDWNFNVAETADASILAAIANPFAYIILPIVGVISWQLAAAAITGFIAKENVVGTLAVCLGMENLINTEELQMMEGAGAEVATVFAITKVAALAYLMFNLFTPPCFAAIGAMNSEMKSKKWLFGGIAFQFAVGYIISYLVYQVGTLVVTGSFGVAFVPGLITVALMSGIIAILCIKGSRKA